MTRLFGLASMLVSIGAGIYLVSTKSPVQNNALEVLAHGIGAYFIAKGLYMGATLFAQAGYSEMLRSLGAQDRGEQKAAEARARREEG